MSSASSVDTWLQLQLARLLDSESHWLSPARGSDNLLEMLLPHGNELFPTLSQESARKTWSVWLPPDDGAVPTEPATASSTLVVSAAGGETLDRAALSATLTRFHREDRIHLLQRGAPALHACFGVLDWQDAGGERLRSPLITMPVRLQPASRREAFLLRWAGAPALVNPALERRLGRLDLRLPPVPDGEQQLSAYLDACQARLAAQPGWRVSSTCWLGLFPVFAGSLHDDLDKNAHRLKSSPILRALAGDSHALPRVSFPDEAELDSLPEADSVLEADGSQRLCLEAARRGASFVLLAPAGTGKTHTVVNLVADCLARNQSVLVVSERPSALSDLAGRLRDAGLGRWALELHDARASSQEVVAELARLIDEKPEPRQAVPAGDTRRVDELRTALREYARAVHEVRQPLGRSAWDVLSELAGWHDLPALPLGATEPFDFSDVSPGRFKEYEQAIEQLERHRHVSAACAWQGYKADRHTRQVRDDALGLLDKVRTRLDKLESGARHVAEQLGAGVQPGIGELRKLADLLESRPVLASATWLRNADLDRLAADVEACAMRFQDVDQTLAPLKARYGRALWQATPDTAQQIQAAWQSARALLAAGDENGAQLLAQQQKLRGWAADTQKRIPGWLSETRALEKWLAIPLPVGAGAIAASNAEGRLDPAPSALKVFLRLVHLCQSEYAPERTWVHNAELVEQTRQLLTSARPIFASYRQNRQKLLAVYTEEFFELDLEQLATTFAGRNGSWLRVFSGSFRRARRTVARRSRHYGLPASAADDVLLGRDTVQQKAHIEAEHLRRKVLLGRYEKNLDTDLEAAEKALRIAGEAQELVHKLGCSSLPARLVDVLCSTTPAPDKVRAADKRLQDSFSVWLHATHEIEDLLAGQLGSGASVEDTALSGLAQYAKDLQASLNQLANLIDPILRDAPSPPSDLMTLLADLNQAAGLRDALANQTDEMAVWQERLGPAFRGPATDWNAVRQALDWTRRVCEWLASNGISMVSESAATLLVGEAGLSSLREFRHALESYQQALHNLETHFDPPGPLLAGRPLAEHPPPDVLRHLAFLRDHIGQLAEWLEWRDLPGRLKHLGLLGFWHAAQHTPSCADRLGDTFAKSFWTAWLDDLCRREPGLANFRASVHEQRVKEFRELDRQQADEARARILARIEECHGSRALDARETRVVKREQDKTVGHMSLAELLGAVPKLLQALKPCLFMTPLAVSRLPSSEPAALQFDVAIVDGQDMPTEEALAALYRAAQVIVAGDPLQLGPPSFFDGAGASENLLQTCLAAGLPRHALRCHYASQHEGLIAFANRRFYDDRLVTVPSPRTTERPARLVHVPDGKCDAAGRNRREAEVIAELVLDRLRRGADRSLAVLTLSRVQATLVEDEIERRLRDHPELENAAAKLFVRSIDVAQGVRADVVVLGIGCGGDDTGEPAATALPWQQEDAARRLARAVTRARLELVVVSSLDSRQLAASNASGAKLLADFLAHVETEPEAAEACRTALHRDVQDALRQLGHEALAHVGLGKHRMDLAVRHPSRPGEFLLGIRFDGPDYASFPLTRERDRLRHELLCQRGWKVHMIWAQGWVQRRAEEIERLARALCPAAP